MGMYTELHFNAEVKDDHDALAVLHYMVGNESARPADLPGHELFSTERWEFMLRCDSAYFDAETHSTLRETEYGNYLCVRCNLKNYDGEIEAFLDWIGPHLAKHEGEVLGFYRYEEDEQPTLIFHADPASSTPEAQR